MIQLNDVETKLAEQLLITIIKKEPTVSYKELAERIEPQIHPRQVGKNILKISELCHELRLPLISAKVVNHATGTPGDGLYPLFEQLKISTDGLSTNELFKRELGKIRSCQEWYRLSDYLKLELFTDCDSPEAAEEIRLLPMNKASEFPGMTYDEIQKSFFMNQLINEQQGCYYFRSTGLVAPKGSLVLFQIDGEIIASATLIETRKFEKPREGDYNGALVFDVHSVSVFSPIFAEELTEIDESFKGFSQVKQRLDYSKLDDILNLINKKKLMEFPEELNYTERKKCTEGAKKQVTVNAYERSARARQECIRIHGTTCSICGFDFGEIYGEDFEDRIHVHHIKPLNEIDDTYIVDPATDLIPVCPNCHMVLHLKKDGVFTTEEVRQMLCKRK